MPGAYHFSVDDVHDGLVGDGHPLLDFLVELHARYGGRSDLYLFHRRATRTLEAIPASVADRLQQLDWLGLGPHGEDYETAPYAQTLAEQRTTIARIYGALDRVAPGAARARWLRLHYFSECFELAPELRARGVEALLTTDKQAGSYRLPAPRRDELLRSGRTTHEGLGFIRSHFRVETLARDASAPGEAERLLDAILAAQGSVVIFTHEIDLLDEATRAMAHRCLSHLQRVGARAI